MLDLVNWFTIENLIHVCVKMPVISKHTGFPGTLTCHYQIPSIFLLSG